MRLRRTAQRAVRAVYHSIIVLAVILVADDGDQSASKVILAVIGATIATALAELYAEYIGDVIRERRHPTGPELRIEFADTLAGSLAALVPAIPFVVVLLTPVKLDAAYAIAPWLGLGVIAFFTLLANRFAGLSRWQNAAVTAAALAVGLSLIAIKAFTH